MEHRTTKPRLTRPAHAGALLRRARGRHGGRCPDLSDAADHGHHAVRRRQRERRGHPHPARARRQIDGPALRRRQPARRRRQYRHAARPPRPHRTDTRWWGPAPDRWPPTARSIAISATIRRRISTPIAMIGIFPIVIVASTKLPVKTLDRADRLCQGAPEQLNYGSVGIGSSQHLSGALFRAARRRQAHPRALPQHRAVHART